MEQLKLEHITPYLPYGLKAKLSREGIYNLDSEFFNEYSNSICTITDLNIYQGKLSGSMSVDISTRGYSFDFDELSEINILLRPMSDLILQINHNGDNLIPINKMKHIYGWDYLWYNVISNKEEFNVNALKYSCVKKLLSWHFDIFGLIEKGLAIDINTL